MMKLYNTLSQQIESFHPLGTTVTVYVCGITPYDTTHLGHAFTFTVADNLIRYLEYSGKQICYAQNVTDIDDDILRKAQQVGEEWDALGRRWTRHFIRDMVSLNVRAPDYYAKVTDFIDGIIAWVRKLVDSGFAYRSGGNVYFDVSSYGGFGELSHYTCDEMRKAFIEQDVKPDNAKRAEFDFVLWQAQAPGEPAWESPWGKGRPGWHSQCAVIITTLLGRAIDLHMGGEDLVFPHHDSVVAQAESLTGVHPFARHWLHVASVRHEGKKMSKSIGNLVLVHHLLDKYDADSIRLYLAEQHYRTSWSFEAGSMQKAAARAREFRRSAAIESGANGSVDPAPREREFRAAMDDDLDTPRALLALEHLSHDISEGAAERKSVRDAQDRLRELAGVLGLSFNQRKPEERVSQSWEGHLRRFQEV